MKNKSSKVIFIIIALFLLFGLGIWLILSNREETVNQDEILYTYTVYEDHVVLEKYLGNEETVVIPDMIEGKPVTKIGKDCFELNKTIKTVVLTANIECIGKYAFDGCDNLGEVYGGEKVSILCASAFARCENLRRVEIGNKLEQIGNFAFRNCESLTSLATQENILYIGYCAFSDSGLERFVFNKEALIDGSAFKNTKWIQNQPEEFIIYGDGNLIGYNGTNKEVVVPDEVKVLNDGCFQGATDMNIYIPETVHTIREFAFVHGVNVNVYIPESVQQMGDEKGDYTIMNSDDKVTVYTTFQSYAHMHALEHEIPFEILGKREFERIMRLKADGE